MHIPAKSTLDIAKERLQRFMAAETASLKDCAKIMGLRDEKPLKQLLKAEGSHTHADMVMAEFGHVGLKSAVAKLHVMRNPEPEDIGASEDAQETEEKEAIQQLARRMYDLYRKGQACKVSITNTIEMMNARKPVFVSRSFSWKSLSSALCPALLNSLSKHYAEDILYALACLNWTVYPPELKGYQVKVGAQKVSDISEPTKSERQVVSDISKPKNAKAPRASYLSSSIQAKALAAIDAFKKEHGFSDAKESKELGFSAGNIGQIRMAFNNKTLGEKAAERLLKKIYEYSPIDIEKAESVSTSEEREQEAAKPVHDDTAPIGNQLAAEEQDACEVVKRQHQIEDIIDRLQSNPQFRSVLMRKAREIAASRIEQELNVSLEQLREVAPMVDVLIAAKRNNVRVQLVVG